MDTLNRVILDLIATWSEPAQQHLLATRAILLDVADSAEVGALEESLKWGQPAWRPRKARTGATLRLNWTADRPDKLMAFVDCKTDLASQMSTRFPGQYHNDGRRALGFDLDRPLPGDAVAQLAYLTFTYHRAKA